MFCILDFFLQSEEETHQFATEARSMVPAEGQITAPQMEAPVTNAVQIPEAVETAINAVANLQPQIACKYKNKQFISFHFFIFTYSKKKIRVSNSVLVKNNAKVNAY
jgi:hypothetical protein